MTAVEQVFHSTTLKSAAAGPNESSSPSVRLNVADVSAQFNLEYYNTMSRQPDHLHGFYGKQSQMVHSTEGDLEAPICITLETIHNRILSMGYQGARIIVESIDAQASLNGGIFILTTGNMKLKSGAVKKFVQSFFLAEQPNGYYVLNDCFRFVDGATKATAPTPSVAAPVPVVVEEPKKVVAAAPVVVAEPVPVAAPAAAPAVAAVEEKKPEVAAVAAPRAEPKPAPKKVEEPKPVAAPSAPSSWASMAAGRAEMWQDGVVAASKGPIVSAVTETPKDSVRRDQNPTRTFTSKNAQPTEQRRDARPRDGARDSPRSADREGNVRSPRSDKPAQDFNRSVFIRNLGANPDSSALRKLLEAAGTITQFDFHTLKGQAFVEFESPQMAVTAINAKYQLNGVTFTIEARRPAGQRFSGNRDRPSGDRPSGARPAQAQ